MENLSSLQTEATTETACWVEGHIGRQTSDGMGLGKALPGAVHLQGMRLFQRVAGSGFSWPPAVMPVVFLPTIPTRPTTPRLSLSSNGSLLSFHHLCCGRAAARRPGPLRNIRCPKRARPGLREPEVGNHPRPPGVARDGRAGGLYHGTGPRGQTPRTPPSGPSPTVPGAPRPATVLRAERRVASGDGAAWIWNIADEHFPGAAQIADVFHALNTCSTSAQAAYGDDNDPARAWARRRLRRPAPGRRRPRRPLGGGRGESHLADNRSRVDYPAFREGGLCIGRGVVEGACSNIICGRLTRGGMRWTVAGADAIPSLRSCIVGNRFDGFRKRRPAQECDHHLPIETHNHVGQYT